MRPGRAAIRKLGQKETKEEMSKPTAVSPNSSPKPPKPPRPANMPTLEQITGEQIDQLLGILNCSFPYVLKSHAGVGETPQEILKEAAMSAEVTVMNACSRLDKILSEDKRWTSGTYDMLEDSLRGVYDSQSQLNKATEDALHQQQRPSITLKPTLTQVAAGHWIANYGGKNGLTGEGATPAEAFQRFDFEFYGMVEQLAQEEAQKKPAKRKKK